MRGEFFMPRLADRQKREASKAGDDASSRAREYVQRIKGSPPQSRLPGAVREQVLKRFPAIREAPPAE